MCMGIPLRHAARAKLMGESNSGTTFLSSTLSSMPDFFRPLNPFYILGMAPSLQKWFFIASKRIPKGA